MAKYWKLLGVVLVVGILAGIMVAAVPAAKPDQSAPESQLFTLIDGESVGIGGTFDSDYIDVSGFTQFKGFVRWDGSANAGGSVFGAFIESLDGVTDVSLSSPSASNTTAIAISSGGDFTVFFNPALGPYKHLKAQAWHTSTTDAQTISVFLYAVP